MNLETALTDYFSKTIGTLIGVLVENKVIDKAKAMELIDIITEGVDDISNSFKVKKSTLDSETES